MPPMEETTPTPEVTPVVDETSQVAVDTGAALETSEPNPLEFYTSLGISDAADENEARQRLADGYQKAQQERETYLAKVREQQALLDHYQQLVRNPSAVQQPTQVQSNQSKGWWSPPEFDRAMAQRYYSNGQWSPDTPAHVRQAGEQWSAYIEQYQERLLTDPPSVLAPAITEVVERLLEERLGQFEQKREVESAIDSFVATNSEWLFERDPVTRQESIDPLTGQAKLSAQGREFQAAVMKLEKMGVTNQKDQIQLAMQLVGQKQRDPGAGARDAAQAAIAQRKAEVRGAGAPAASGPARLQGTQLSGNDPARQQMDFGRRAINSLMQTT